jgi:5-(carboxyamino)imidazole ribonucleotide mutase
MIEYGKVAAERGLKVIIAGAGGAAHLPGMIASATILPVIGVPIQTKTLSGVDSLYSIVQMPPGVPVATVAIGAGKNAGLLAVQILAIGDGDLGQNSSQNSSQNSWAEFFSGLGCFIFSFIFIA